MGSSAAGSMRQRTGTVRIVTELFQIRSVAGLAEAEVPEDELLPEGSASGPDTPVNMERRPLWVMAL